MLRHMHRCMLQIRRDYPLVQLNGWKVWPVAALINYKFVPLQFRVLFINCVALGWSIFLLLRARNMAGSVTKDTAAASKAEVGQQPTAPAAPYALHHRQTTQQQQQQQQQQHPGRGAAAQ
jgi:hypothetical protein